MTSATTVFVARHGERIDHVDRSWRQRAENPHDPFLTETGKRQARALAEKLSDSGLTHIFSSPFYRTVQTANEVAEATGVKIKIEYGICEYLNPDWFPSEPRLKSVLELQKEFPSVDPTYTSQVTPVYPETRSDVIARTGRAAQLLSERFSGVILLVGHGITCEFTVRGITGAGPIPHISYCSLQKCSRTDGSGGKYFIEGSHEPDITFMEEDIRPVVKTSYR